MHGALITLEGGAPFFCWSFRPVSHIAIINYRLYRLHAKTLSKFVLCPVKFARHKQFLCLHSFFCVFVKHVLSKQPHRCELVGTIVNFNFECFGKCNYQPALRICIYQSCGAFLFMLFCITASVICYRPTFLIEKKLFILCYLLIAFWYFPHLFIYL